MKVEFKNHTGKLIKTLYNTNIPCIGSEITFGEKDNKQKIISYLVKTAKIDYDNKVSKVIVTQLL